MNSKDASGPPAGDDYGYTMRPEEERKLPEEDKPQWHVATKSGNQFGPWPMVELKRRAESAGLAADDLVWRVGWPEWKPAKDIAELAYCFRPAGYSSGTPTGTAPAGAMPPNAMPPHAMPPNAMPAGQVPPPPGYSGGPYTGMPYPGGPPGMPGMRPEEKKSFSDWFGDPDFLRVAAIICGCFAGIFLLLAITTWSTYGLLFFAYTLIMFSLFVVVEILATFLERQKAISTRLEKLDKFIRKQETE